ALLPPAQARPRALAADQDRGRWRRRRHARRGWSWDWRRRNVGLASLMRALFIVDPLERLGLAGDTSYALMLEAQRRDHEVWTCQIDHLGLEHDDPIAEAQLTQVSLASR